MTTKKQIIAKLASLEPEIIDLIDRSHEHAHHSSNPNPQQQGTHFDLTIKSRLLENKSRIQQHKIINRLLESEFKNGLHALSIKII